MFGIIKAMEFNSTIERKIGSKKSAGKLNLDECTGCTRCCYQKPCNLNGTEDIEKISKFLNISTDELVSKYLCIDIQSDIEGLCIIPIREGTTESNGRFLSDYDSFVPNPCIFLKDGKCSLHEVKPEGGAMYKCWESNEGKSYPGISINDTVKLFKLNADSLYEIFAVAEEIEHPLADKLYDKYEELSNDEEYDQLP